MTAVKAIRSEADYEAALARIDQLMDAAPGTPEGEELDVLTDLVEHYEERAGASWGFGRPTTLLWSYHRSYYRAVPVVKRSFSIDPEVWAAVRRAVGPEPRKVSAFVNEALANHARIVLGLRAVAVWEAEHGTPSPKQLAEADRRLDAASVGMPRSGTGSG